MLTLLRAVTTGSLVLAAALQSAVPIKDEVDALNAAMVAAFKRDPATVAGFYGDNAAIVGGGQRVQGRAAVDAYWKTGTFSDWSLETLDTGGPPEAPWQYGRSILRGRSGTSMETYFVGLLRRDPAGSLKFQVDAFTRERGATGGEDAARVLAAYTSAVERADTGALQEILDDQFVIVSTTARDKAAEIADLVPASGARAEYFRAVNVSTRGFGALAVATGTLQWRFGGRDIERRLSAVFVKRGAAWKLLGQVVAPIAR